MNYGDISHPQRDVPKHDIRLPTFNVQLQLVLATILDRRFGCGLWSEPNRCQIDSPGLL